LLTECSSGSADTFQSAYSNNSRVDDVSYACISGAIDASITVYNAGYVYALLLASRTSSIGGCILKFPE